jgi:hypothetical protein
MKEVRNVLRVLEQTLYAIENDNPHPLKELSDQTLHSATTGDEDNLLVAIIIYSIGKILERQNYRTLKGWESFQRIVKSAIKCSINDLKNNNTEKFRKDFTLIKKAINKISGKLKIYVEEVFKKAEINKGSRIYEHGISMEKTAKMLGVTLYDLQNYIGHTGVSEVELNHTIHVKNRIKILEELFRE